MPFWKMLVLQASQTVGAFDLAQMQRTPEPSTVSVIPQCEAGENGSDIVVCGQRRDLYRLPLPKERGEAADLAPHDMPGGMAALTPAGRCGIFAGERRCSKRESARYGYGEGRDPITVLSQLAKKAADPNAD